jgi:DNA-binding NtrC family response regulator
MFARAIHHLSGRRDLPFIPVDCAALPENLFESELFGHVRGAFTDAHRDQKGLIALAGAGTLFLDEIDALSIQTQSKLLRFLQERTYRPVGSDRFMRADLKIIAASNQDLEGLVHDGKFRSDLFFRLNVLRLRLSPLRERRDDIALLVRNFLRTLAAENGTRRKSISSLALQHLTDQQWPGNIRELYNTVQRAVVLCEANEIQQWHLADSSRLQDIKGSEIRPYREARASVLEAFERNYIKDMLRKASGNVTMAARLADKDRRVFGRMMKRHNILRDSA